MAKLYKFHDKLDDLALYLMTNEQGHVLHASVEIKNEQEMFYPNIIHECAAGD